MKTKTYTQEEIQEEVDKHFNESYVEYPEDKVFTDKETEHDDIIL